jgi:hypothetical protein
MKDIKQRIEKLRVNAEDCILISKLATSPTKREAFRKLADEYQSMARELEERIASGDLTGDLGI